jgi:hypothetical protein
MVTVLMPEEAGALRLPTLSVPWWDTQVDELRYATLPGAELWVAKGTLASLPSAPPSAQPLENAATFGADSVEAPPPAIAPLEDDQLSAEEVVPEDSAPLGPAWGSLLLALLGLLGAMGLWRWRQGQAAVSTDRPTQGAPSPRKALRSALAAEDRDAAYAALLRWQRSPDGQAAPEAVQAAVHEALATLGAERYGHAPADQGMSWAELKTLAGKLSAKGKPLAPPPLPALYPP